MIRFLNWIFKKDPIIIPKNNVIKKKPVKYDGDDLLNIDEFILESKWRELDVHILKEWKENEVYKIINPAFGNVYVQVKSINNSLWAIVLNTACDFSRGDVFTLDNKPYSHRHNRVKQLIEIPDYDKLVFCTNCKYHSERKSDYVYNVPDAFKFEIMDNTIPVYDTASHLCFKNTKLFYKDTITPYGITKSLTLSPETAIKKCDEKK